MTDKQSQATTLARQVSTALPVAQELHRAGWSYSRIADHLQSEGIPTPSRWKGKPTSWHGKSVKRLLDQAKHNTARTTQQTTAEEEPPGSEQGADPTAASPAGKREAERPYATVDVSGAVTITTTTGSITESGVRVTINPPDPSSPSSTPLESSLIERVDTLTLLAILFPGSSLSSRRV